MLTVLPIGVICSLKCVHKYNYLYSHRLGIHKQHKLRSHIIVNMYCYWAWFLMVLFFLLKEVCCLPIA